MLTRILILLFALISFSAVAVPTVNCTFYKSGEYSVSQMMPLYNGYPFKFDLEATTSNQDYLQARVEAKQNVRYGDLVPFRTTIYINLFEVVARDQFILVLPFGRSYFQRIRFEGHELACRIL